MNKNVALRSSILLAIMAIIFALVPLLRPIEYMAIIKGPAIKTVAFVKEHQKPTVRQKKQARAMTSSQLKEEQYYDQLELLAQLVQAEAGNQGVQGMRYVACVVLNRVDHPKFPDTIEEVIFQPGAFGVVKDGALDRAAWNMSEKAYQAVMMEIQNRSDLGILYFNTEWVNGKDPWKYGDHWFSY